jgi:hypothetical protein
MIFLASVLAGILCGFLIKGRLSGLTNMALRVSWLLLPFLVIDIFLNSRHAQVVAGETLRWAVLLLLIIQYGALFTLAGLNAKRWPLLVIGAGEALNFIVIMANGGRMPVNAATLPDSPRLKALASGVIPHYGMLTEHTTLPFLGDVIPFSLFSPSLISMGDIVIMAGLFLLMAHAMKAGLKTGLRPGSDPGV